MKIILIMIKKNLIQNTTKNCIDNTKITLGCIFLNAKSFFQSILFSFVVIYLFSDKSITEQSI